MLTGDMAYRYESGSVGEMTVENVTFSGNRAVVSAMPEFTPSEKEPYYHKRLTVKNCTFDSEDALSARWTQTIRFVNNVNARGKHMKVVLSGCGASEIEGAQVIKE